METEGNGEGNSWSWSEITTPTRGCEFEGELGERKSEIEEDDDWALSSEEALVPDLFAEARGFTSLRTISMGCIRNDLHIDTDKDTYFSRFCKCHGVVVDDFLLA